MLRARLMLAGCLLAAVAGAAACPVPQNGRKLLDTPYGNSLSACVARAGLKWTAAVIAAAGDDVNEYFTNCKSSVTFFSPDDKTWGSIAKTANTTIQALINRPGFPDYFLRNHMLADPHQTSFWPAPGEPGKFLPSLEGTELQLWSDSQYTNRVMYLYNTKTRLACSESNLVCGDSIMHVTVDPELYTERK